MAAAIVVVCVDPRLNHEVIRTQVRQRLQRSGISADRIYVLNDIGANPGPNLSNTLNLLSRANEAIAFSAVLHHDDCLAARQGLRMELSRAADEMARHLQQAGSAARVATGEIQTQHNLVLWTDEPRSVYVPFQMHLGQP
jgi:hypothetical protein